MIGKSVFQELKEGVLYFLKNKNIRFAAWVMFILSSALGAASVVLIAFVQEAFHSLTRDLGLLSMFMGVGLFSGSLVYGRFGHGFSQHKIIFTSLISSGIILTVFALTIGWHPHFGLATLLTFLMGFLVSPIIIATNTIVHKVSSNEMMGKTFSSLEIVMHLGFIIFMFVSGFLAEKFSNVSILVATGVLFIVLGIVNLLLHRKLPWLD